MVWFWVLGGLLVWILLASFVALVVGRSIRLADGGFQRAGSRADGGLPDAPPGARSRAATVWTRRRSIPLPPIGVGLAALAVTLMTVGYVARLTGSDNGSARLLSMDQPFSIPSLFVALVFAAAAVAAVAGAAVLPGRRVWWLAVGGVAAVIAAVKAAGPVYDQALLSLKAVLGDTTALVVSAAAAGLVLTVLWFLSRDDRRDRRRVVGVLALYAFAAVGLSAVSGIVPSGLYVTATFLEESGEALAGVAFLMAVLVGVAPQLVLPADWALRRRVDAETIVVSDALPGRSGTIGS